MLVVLPLSNAESGKIERPLPNVNAKPKRRCYKGAGG